MKEYMKPVVELVNFATEAIADSTGVGGDLNGPSQIEP